MTFPERQPVSKQVKVLWIDTYAFSFLEGRRELLEEVLGGEIRFLGSTTTVMEILVEAAENKQLPDIVVSETELECGINGLALAEEIRAHDDEEIKNLPICLLTVGWPERRKRVRAEKLGVIIERKAGLKENLETIRSLCERK